MPGLPHRGHGLNVVPVPVRLHHLVHAQAAADLEQFLVLVGGVDQQGLAGAAAAEHVDVVVHRADDNLVYFGGGVAPDLLQRSHPTSVGTIWSHRCHVW